MSENILFLVYDSSYIPQWVGINYEGESLLNFLVDSQNCYEYFICNNRKRTTIALDIQFFQVIIDPQTYHIDNFHPIMSNLGRSFWTHLTYIYCNVVFAQLLENSQLTLMDGMERLLCNFHYLAYYCSPNLSIHQNSTQEPTSNLLVTLFYICCIARYL